MLKVAPVTASVVDEAQASARGAAPATGDAATRAWADAHAAEIEQYNGWATQRETYSQRVRRWRENGDD